MTDGVFRDRKPNPLLSRYLTLFYRFRLLLIKLLELGAVRFSSFQILCKMAEHYLQDYVLSMSYGHQ